MSYFKKCSYCGRKMKNKAAWMKHEASRKKNGICSKKMKNITINLPDNYDNNIQKLIKMKLLPSRSEAVRRALGDFIEKEYGDILELFSFFGGGQS